jgi:Mor family transcriptional regulator
VTKLQDQCDKDKHKENGIILTNSEEVKLSQEVMSMAKNDAELLNAVYREIGEKMGLDAAMEIYQLFKGQQISFPVRFFNPKVIRQSIIQEYNGKNVRTLAVKYGYSEKTIRRIIKESVDEE